MRSVNAQLCETVLLSLSLFPFIPPCSWFYSVWSCCLVSCGSCCKSTSALPKTQRKPEWLRMRGFNFMAGFLSCDKWFSERSLCMKRLLFQGKEINCSFCLLNSFKDFSSLWHFALFVLDPCLMSCNCAVWCLWNALVSVKAVFSQLEMGWKSFYKPSWFLIGLFSCWWNSLNSTIFKVT